MFFTNPDHKLVGSDPARPLAVALSGGADSLYSLLELKRAGADVFGLHALFLPPRLRRPDYADMLVRLEKSCAFLDVPFYVTDLSQAFEALVIAPFVRAYAESLTPNPCAACNRDLKFGLLLEEATRLGADGLVTGHYARLLDCADADGSRPGLFNGLDPRKDQSYFLALTPLDKLRQARFPLGGRQKSAVLAELAALGLEVPQAGESQEICFVPGDDYRAFLRSMVGQASAAPGAISLRGACPAQGGPGQGNNPFRDTCPAQGGQHNLPALGGSGPVALYRDPARVIGRHQGLWAYTEGQRHGLGIAWSEPLYVLGKDVAANTLLVGVKSDFKASFEKQDCVCGSLNFLLPFAVWPQNLLVKTRYRQTPRPARAFLQTVYPIDANREHVIDYACVETLLCLEFLDSDHAPPPAPGQVAAIYAPWEMAGQSLRLLAGGIILRKDAA